MQITPFSIVLFCIAVVFVLLGIPLARRKVKRNMWYGYRISLAVMTDDDIWYAVNEMGGRHMCVLGALFALVAAVGLFTGEKTKGENALAIFMVVGVFVFLIVSLVKTLRLSSRLAREKGID